MLLEDDSDSKWDELFSDGTPQITYDESDPIQLAQRSWWAVNSQRASLSIASLVPETPKFFHPRKDLTF